MGKHSLPGYGSVTHGNRLVRTRMPGGVAGARLTAAPYADQRDPGNDVQVKDLFSDWV